MSIDDTTETEEAKRGRGRPTMAELAEREKALEARAAQLAEREKLLELQAAEANMEMLERELASRQEQVAAGRLSARTGTLRSDDVTQPARGRRYRGGTDMPNKFHIEKEDIPVGTSYQWNNHTIFGQEQHSYSAFMQMQGWEPVHSSRHPHLCPAGYDGPIIVDGQILMERPAELTNEALGEELDKARGEVRMKEEQLYGPAPGIANQAPRQRDNGTNDFIKVKKGFEAGEPARANYQYETPGQGGMVVE